MIAVVVVLSVVQLMGERVPVSVTICLLSLSL